MAYLAEYVLWQAQSAVAVNLLIQPVSDLQDLSGCEQLIDASAVSYTHLAWKSWQEISASAMYGIPPQAEVHGRMHSRCV